MRPGGPQEGDSGVGTNIALPTEPSDGQVDYRDVWAASLPLTLVSKEHRRTNRLRSVTEH
jgi:hypothetical protein